jgi:hypothetical protein
MRLRGEGNVQEQHREQLDAFMHTVLDPGEQVEVILLTFTGTIRGRRRADLNPTWYSVLLTDRRVFCLLWNLTLRQPLSVQWSASRSEVSARWRPSLFPWWVYVAVAGSQKKLVLERAGHEPTRLNVITLGPLLADAEKLATVLHAS